VANFYTYKGYFRKVALAHKKKQLKNNEYFILTISKEENSFVVVVGS